MTVPVTTSQHHSTPRVAATTELQCVVCKRRFDFTAGEAAVVLRHVAYYYDFAHEGRVSGACTGAGSSPSHGYDCAAFSQDQERLRIVRAERDWALVEHADGWCRLEVIAREAGSGDRARAVRSFLSVGPG